MDAEAEKKMWNQITEMMRRIVDRLGVKVTGQKSRIKKGDNYKAIDISYDVNGNNETKGICRIFYMIVKNIGYGFMGISIRNDIQNQQAIFSQMIDSIKIGRIGK